MDVGDEQLNQAVLQIHLNRWSDGYSIMHGVGYLLDPEFLDMEQDTEPDTLDAFHQFVDKTFQMPLEPGADANAAERQAFQQLVRADPLRTPSGPSLLKPGPG
eukprot:4741147-Pyramimonas_sp.AAC.1